eukprot:gb/GECH01001493.1/.p1 GENE.gb/GECH01001493.1/~~gb/GECH01001493.1/.p1  ORF type:complete len:396 (+),score=50.54 gb/GECH01001493.1/:1-1188(+)
MKLEKNYITLYLVLVATAFFATAGATFLEPGRWEKLDVIGHPPTGGRDGMASCSLDGKLYFFGGNDIDYRQELNTVHYNDLYRFHPCSNTWELVEPANGVKPGSREHAILVPSEDEGKLYMYMGVRLVPYETRTNFTATEFFNDVWEFDVASQTWSLIAPDASSPLPNGRGGARGFRFGSYLYAFSGYTPVFTNDMWRFNLDTRQWEEVTPSDSTVPSVRTNAASTFDGYGAFYLYGGLAFDPSQGGFVRRDDFYRYDVHHNRWTALPVSNTVDPARIHPTLDYLRGRIILYGGDRPGSDPGVCSSPNGDKVSNETFVYHRWRNEWSQVVFSDENESSSSPSLSSPPPLQYHASGVVGRCVYMTGGYSVFVESGECQVHNNDMYRICLQPSWAHS